MQQGQSKIESFVEAIVNVIIGSGVSLVAQLIIFPMVLDAPVTMGQNFILLAFFTVVSVARSYFVRRFFNTYLKRLTLHLSAMVLRYKLKGIDWKNLVLELGRQYLSRKK